LSFNNRTAELAALRQCGTDRTRTRAATGRRRIEAANRREARGKRIPDPEPENQSGFRISAKIVENWFSIFDFVPAQSAFMTK
jgi:hypothetical protein